MKNTATRIAPVKGRKLYKMFSTETKALDAKGAIEAVMSSEVEDRDGDVIRAKGWILSDFIKHPALIADHNYGDITNQIGEWSDVRVEGTKLVGVANYYIGEGNAKADWAYNLAKKGKAAYSVGFIPLEWEERNAKNPKRPAGNYGYEFLSQELLETSQVTIPSNPDAVQLAKLVSGSENFRPEFIEMAENLAKSVYGHDKGLTVAEKEMETCYSDGCENDAGLSLPLCKGCLSEMIMRSYSKSEDEITDAVVEIKDAESDAVVVEAEVELVSVDIKAEVKSAVKEALIELGMIKEVSEVESIEAEVKSEEEEAIVVATAEETPVETKDLSEDSLADGGALVEEVQCETTESEAEEKEVEVVCEDSEEKSGLNTDEILKAALEAMFVTK